MFKLKKKIKPKVLARNDSFNKNRYERESHNCYSYFLNLHSKKATEICKNELNVENYCRRSQPGYASGYPVLKPKDFTCKEIVKRTLDDNPKMFKVKRNKSCPVDYYKGAIVVAPGVDYHYYRLNDEGVWTHKPGYKPSTFLDAKNNVIKDPLTADRNYGPELNYTDFCGYTCLPRNPLLKHMKMNTNKRTSDNSNKTIKQIIVNKPLPPPIVRGRNKTRKIKKRKTNKRKIHKRKTNKRKIHKRKIK
jgi:hypothetical protein